MRAQLAALSPANTLRKKVEPRKKTGRQSLTRAVRRRKCVGASAPEVSSSRPNLGSAPRPLLRRPRVGAGPLQPVDRLLRLFRLRPMRQNLHIAFVFLKRFVRTVHLLQAYSEMKRSRRVVVFVNQRLAIPILRPAIILALEIKISDLNIFRRLVRIPKMKFAHIGISCRSIHVGQSVAAFRMRLGIIRGRAQINLVIFAGTLAIGQRARIDLVRSWRSQARHSGSSGLALSRITRKRKLLRRSLRGRTRGLPRTT